MHKELVVVGIEIYKKDIRVIRHVKRKKQGNKRRIWFYDADGNICINESYNKGEIYEFSESSKKNLTFVASNTEFEFDRMFTLTYPREWTRNGKEVKRHLGVMLQWLRRRNIVAYLWFLEFQGRGAPHFHILTFGGDFVDRMELSSQWFRTVASGDIEHYKAGTNIRKRTTQRGLNRYTVKYAAKRKQKAVPPDYRSVGRLWGCSQNVYPRDPLFVRVDSEKALQSLLKDWRFAGEETNGYSVLFDASDAVVSLLLELGYFDKSDSGVGEFHGKH